ncbi:MAG: MoaD/ThiS family protein [Chloroflexi bacterium]|nr:MoaD/ThiS family protein [Chloroflexota bacterium]
MSLINVEVKLFGGLQRLYPDIPLGQAQHFQVEKGTTIAQLLTEQLQLPPQNIAITLINGRRYELTHILRDNESLSLFPPIAGGD